MQQRLQELGRADLELRHSRRPRVGEQRSGLAGLQGAEQLLQAHPVLPRPGLGDGAVPRIHGQNRVVQVVCQAADLHSWQAQGTALEGLACNFKLGSGCRCLAVLVDAGGLGGGRKTGRAGAERR